ncbi:MAG TPA: hypothetical protein VF736_11285 [Pyrinomonadaceae bacterium]|jgi:hypothetical protein
MKPTIHRGAFDSLAASLLCAAALALCAPCARARGSAQEPTRTQEQAGSAAPAPRQQEEEARPTPPQGEKAADAAPADEPLYSEFKGVKIGTGRDEVRKRLGRPQENDKTQDFFVFSDRERARVYYDDKGAATAVIVAYVGKSGDIPTPKALLGSDVEPKPDGSLYKIVHYPKAGYWVAYSCTAGDEPLTIITMQKMGQ